ncbi:MAG: hypothetical protein HY885_16810 [Deltaproteobacteria bacterium]|nr:hypothetical protein [Deltaproteobacteria bacterium]
MKKQKMTITMAAMLTLPILGFTGSTFASEGADNYKESCETCHSYPVIPDTHHIYAEISGTGCLTCHKLGGSESQGFALIPMDGNTCFLTCHTPILYRDAAGYLARATPEGAEEAGWDITVNVRNKIGAFHHENYGGPDYSGGQCYKCHALEWDPTINAVVTNPVEGSASDPQDANNIIIVLEPEELVYNLRPGGTLILDASGSNGDITWVRWSINNQTISSGMSFKYTFKRCYIGDTFVVKVEMKDREGRYAKQNIGVNIR